MASVQTTIKRKLTSNARCMICKQRIHYMQDPRWLPCTHIFCIGCLSATVGSKCGVCNKSYDKEKLTELERVDVEEDIVGIKCDLCSRDDIVQATQYCEDCDQRMCAQHTLEHSRRSKASSHTTVEIKRITSRILEEGSHLCEEHNKLTSWECRRCRKLFCEICAASSAVCDKAPITSHADDAPRLLKCAECDFRCAFEHQLKKHSKSHSTCADKRFECNQCDYSTTQNGALQKHMRTHSGEKPYACAHCDYRTTQNGALQTHMRTHTGEKPYACTHCDYRAKQSCHLQRHMRTHTGEKPYACTHCDYQTARRSTLLTHMRTHRREKPYACTHCDYRTTTSGHLQRHMRTHQTSQ